MSYKIIRLTDKPQLKERAARWFHERWGVPLEAYGESMKEKGIDTLYLLTDHTAFYERYGWEFLCMVQGDGEPDMSRKYMHR
ncbi:MAG: hypothetical protein NC400_03470 [Clostridium sp.]|nr:hypothetical protein [Clostridium sp.]